MRRYVIHAEARSGKNQMRILKRKDGRFFIGKSQKAGDFIHEAQTALTVQQGRTRPLEGPCAVTLVIYRRTRQRIDLDNLVSAIFDAMKGIVFDDDSQVVRLVAEKRVDPERPRVEIGLEAYTLSDITPLQEAA